VEPILGSINLSTTKGVKEYRAIGNERANYGDSLQNYYKNPKLAKSFISKYAHTSLGRLGGDLGALSYYGYVRAKPIFLIKPIRYSNTMTNVTVDPYTGRFGRGVYEPSNVIYHY
jgi:hypothetical protein